MRRSSGLPVSFGLQFLAGLFCVQACWAFTAHSSSQAFKLECLNLTLSSNVTGSVNFSLLLLKIKNRTARLFQIGSRSVTVLLVARVLPSELTKSSILGHPLASVAQVCRRIDGGIDKRPRPSAKAT